MPGGDTFSFWRADSRPSLGDWLTDTLVRHLACEPLGDAQGDGAEWLGAAAEIETFHACEVTNV